jgi:hypothetical protein
MQKISACFSRRKLSEVASTLVGLYRPFSQLEFQLRNVGDSHKNCGLVFQFRHPKLVANAYF